MADHYVPKQLAYTNYTFSMHSVYCTSSMLIEISEKDAIIYSGCAV